MKKIFTLFAILLALVLPIVSCTTDDVSAKQAQTDRDSLIIPDDEDTSNIQHNQLALYASATNVNVGTLVKFTTFLNGIEVTDQVTYYVNNIQVGGSSITSVSSGTFSVQAKLEGYIDSPVVTVVYTGGGNNPNPDPDPDPEPTGNFIFNGEGYNVVSNVLVLNGAFIDEDGTPPYTSWTSVVLNNTDPELATVAAAIDFKTPFTITNPETNEGTVVFPNGTNEVYTGAQQILVNDQNFEDVVGTGAIHYVNLNTNATSNTFASNINFEGNTLQISYNGAFGYINNAQPAARSANRSSNQAFKISTKKPVKYRFIK